MTTKRGVLLRSKDVIPIQSTKERKRWIVVTDLLVSNFTAIRNSNKDP